MLDIFAFLFSFWSFFNLSNTLHPSFIRNTPLWLSYVLSMFAHCYIDFICFPPLCWNFPFLLLFCSIVLLSSTISSPSLIYSAFQLFLSPVSSFSFPWLLSVFQLWLFPGVFFSCAINFWNLLSTFHYILYFKVPMLAHRLKSYYWSIF